MHPQQWSPVDHIQEGIFVLGGSDQHVSQNHTAMLSCLKCDPLNLHTVSGLRLGLQGPEDATVTLDQESCHQQLRQEFTGCIVLQCQMIGQQKLYLSLSHYMYLRVTGHFAQKTFRTSLLAQVLDRSHNSQWSFRTIIISEKHQYKRYTD